MGTEIFAAAHADELGLDQRERQQKVPHLVQDATDKLKALVRLGPITSALIADVDSRAAAAIADPYDVAEFPIEGIPIYSKSLCMNPCC